ncbi:MAG: class D beta-lactamase, partial [Bacteroidales bacterium]|nr:class D beta-lactamase [Bacteroidales bacterium]
MKTFLKLFFFTVALIFAVSCQNTPTSQGGVFSENQVYVSEYQQILDSLNVEGTIVIHDFDKDIFYSNDFQWANRGQLPASTFKIPNTIIGLETGVLNADTSIFRWDGSPRAMDIWQQDLNLEQAFQYSCVPCYQEVARKIGVERMSSFLTKLDYGNMRVDSNNLDVFWLVGESKITPFEQIDFLERFNFKELPIAESTVEAVKSIMFQGVFREAEIYGKTGWVSRNGLNSGWFVGFAEKEKKAWFFAVNVEPKQGFNMDEFPAV